MGPPQGQDAKILAEAQDGGGDRGRRESGEAKGCLGQRRKGTLTQPGWQLLGPSTGGKEPPAGAFHPPAQPGALGRGGEIRARWGRLGIRVWAEKG